jgi:hypothetical protein
MSSSDVLDSPAEALTRAAQALAAALGDPDRIPDAELRELMAGLVRLYAAKAENGMRTPLPPSGGGVTVTETMIACTDLLHAVNVQMLSSACGRR